ncbi:MAG: roadblock/LC7 domain-containing protein [Cyanobacteria bacterium P01_F01_bin.53]
MAIDIQRIDDIVRAFVTETRHVEGAALLTPAGLPMAGTLPNGLETERAAAMAAAVITIGNRVGEELQRGTVQQLFIQGTEGYSMLTLCGKEALFLVLTTLEAQQGILLLEIRRIVNEISQIIDFPEHSV